MSPPWIAAAMVSIVVHVAVARRIDGAGARKKPRPPIEMTLAELPPRRVEPPPAVPPPPEPPKPKAPKLVAKVAKQGLRPTRPPESQRVGVHEDAVTDDGEIAVSTGVTSDGMPGTGRSMDKQSPPPAPPPPGPPPVHKPRFFPSYEVTQLPAIKKAVQPEIPDAFRQAQREALVVIEVEIDINGRVVNARVLRHGDHGLDEAALAAAKATAFEPALMGTTPVPVRYQLPYRFKVRG